MQRVVNKGYSPGERIRHEQDGETAPPKDVPVAVVQYPLPELHGLGLCGGRALAFNAGFSVRYHGTARLQNRPWQDRVGDWDEEIERFRRPTIEEEHRRVETARRHSGREVVICSKS